MARACRAAREAGTAAAAVSISSAAAGGPLVSVGLPVYNGENFLRLSAESLLAQTYRNIELVISDNASTDATESICRQLAAADPRVRYVRLGENIGAIRNHNRTFEIAAGKYFMWSSHDDIWLPTYVEKCVALLESNRDAVVAYARMGIIDENGAVIRLADVAHRAQSSDPVARFAEFTELFSMLEAVYGVMRSDVARRTPLMRLHPGSDRLFFAELALYGRLLQVPEHLYMRRDHGRRSVRVQPDIRARYMWVSGSSPGRRPKPHWDYLRWYADAIRRVPNPLRVRLACAFHMLKWIKSNWGELALDLKS
jgi:glycosyltransferase involved in cell wall biosynthesis